MKGWVEVSKSQGLHYLNRVLLGSGANHRGAHYSNAWRVGPRWVEVTQGQHDMVTMTWSANHRGMHYLNAGWWQVWWCQVYWPQMGGGHVR